VTTTRRSRPAARDRQRKTEKADRIKALIARGAAYERKEMAERAIADYDGVLRLDPSLADIHNARRTLAQEGRPAEGGGRFCAAIKLNPDHIAARANHRALAQELERLGALKAIAGKPSFNCATARRKVEKAICANPDSPISIARFKARMSGPSLRR
jgi:hypothetical protein